MIKLFIGGKGSGKTKTLIELVNNATTASNGSVVCIEKGEKLMLDISHKIRLVEASEYDIADYTAMKGFISGLYAGNYDISHVYVDNLCKITRNADVHETEKFLNWLERFSEKNMVKFTVTLSADADTATDGMRHYL